MPTEPGQATPLKDQRDPRTAWLMRHEAWLKVLAGLEIESRFQGKFSASDAVQQTLVGAWRDWEKCRGQSEAERRAWLRGILAHELGHLARRYGAQKRAVRREISLEESLAQSSQRIDRLAASHQASPSAHAAAREQSLQLAEMLSRLPDDYRQVLVLRNLEDLPHEEVARRMNRSVGAVRMLWVRALQRLRKELQSLESRGEPG
jgi:RNA polymerase sigma-70 factor, ECF subfamily